MTEGIRLTNKSTHDSPTTTALVTDPFNANTTNAPTAQNTVVILWIFVGLFVSVVLGGTVKLSLYTVKRYKKLPPSLPRRAAEPLDFVGEVAIDPVMSPAVDEFDVEGAPSVQKVKFDKMSKDIRLKHRQYIQLMKRQEKSDADSRKFKKQPPIFIPAFVDDAQFAKKSTMKTMKAPKTPVTSATQLKTAQSAKSMANAKSSKKSTRKPKPAQQPQQQQPQAQAPAKSLVEKSFLV